MKAPFSGKSTNDKALFIFQPIETIHGMTYGGSQWIRKWNRFHGQISNRTVGSSTVATVSDDGSVCVYPPSIDDYRTEVIRRSLPGRSMPELEEWADAQLLRLGAIPVPDSDHWRKDDLMSKLWDRAWMQGLQEAERLDAITQSSVVDLLRKLRRAALEEELPYHVPGVSLRFRNNEVAVAVLEWRCQPRDLTIHVNGEEIFWIFSESSRVTDMKDGTLMLSDLPALRELWRQLLQESPDRVHLSEKESSS